VLDRASHAAYILPVTRGAPPDAPDSFDENLTDAHDELTSAVDVYVESKNWNLVYTAGDALAIAVAHLAQQDRIDRGLSDLMKDCNFLLTNAICNAFNTAPMSVYQHLTNLDFVRNVIANLFLDAFFLLTLAFPMSICFAD